MGESAAAEAALDALIKRIVVATAKASYEGALMVEAVAKAKAPKLSGTLARSIESQGPISVKPAMFYSRVGPTTVYGRIAELGGHIYPIRRQYLAFYWDHAPASMPRLPDGRVLARHVYHRPSPFLKPAVEELKVPFRTLVARRWADAIRGV